MQIKVVLIEVFFSDFYSGSVFNLTLFQLSVSSCKFSVFKAKIINMSRQTKVVLIEICCFSSVFILALLASLGEDIADG